MLAIRNSVSKMGASTVVSILHHGRSASIARQTRSVRPPCSVNLSSRCLNTAENPNSGTSAPPKPTMQDVRAQLLQSAFKHVHEFGWTQDAIAAAAVEQSASISLAGMIQPKELIAFSMDHWNEQLQQDLAVKQDIWKELATPVQSRIEEALKTRLAYLLPFIQSSRWHEGMALGVRDPEAALHTKDQLRQLIHIVSSSVVTTNNVAASAALTEWEQFTLGGVYVTTELHLLTDPSPDYQDTWEFLQQRVGEWERLRLSDSPLSAGGDAMYTATAVASSLAGGVMSLVQPHAMFSKANSAAAGMSGSSSMPEQLWNTLLQQMSPPPSGSTTANSANGTDPSHYDSKTNT